MSDGLRLGFAGTPEFAATILRHLLDAGLVPVVVFTQPDRPTGRGRKQRPSSVKKLAQQYRLEVRDPPSLKAVDLRADRLDLLIVAAYGLILPDHILSAPRLGCLNVHASLLPRWRGAAPVERSIMAGDSQTGVCLMQMDAGLDTGPVYCRAELPIGPSASGGEVEQQLAQLGGELLVTTLPDLASMTPLPQPQSGATYASKITPRDSVPDWTEGSLSLERRVRALSDRAPVTVHVDGDPPLRIRLLQARADNRDPEQPAATGTVIRCDRRAMVIACGSGTLAVTRLQLNRGKGRPMDVAAALNGYPDFVSAGTRLTSRPPATGNDTDTGGA